MTSRTIGIIGGGVVGMAVKNYFHDAAVYDKYKSFDPIAEVGQAKFIFICVPTPDSPEGLDLSMVDDAVANTVRHLTNPQEQLVVIKSTAWPGSTQAYQNKYPEANFAFNPEFLRDKTADHDFANNDRQIIGYTTKTKDSPLLQELLELLPKTPYQKIVPAAAAEMIKYAGNTFLALQVIFANQIYDLCQALEIDYNQVKEAVGADKRIGRTHWEIWHTEASLSSNRQEAYRGYGGKCFPKDINILIAEAKKLGVQISLFEAAREINLQLNQGKYDR